MAPDQGRTIWRNVLRPQAAHSVLSSLSSTSSLVHILFSYPFLLILRLLYSQSLIEHISVILLYNLISFINSLHYSKIPFLLSFATSSTLLCLLYSVLLLGLRFLCIYMLTLFSCTAISVLLVCFWLVVFGPIWGLVQLSTFTPTHTSRHKCISSLL